jgi:hypothetical protein
MAIYKTRKFCGQTSNEKSLLKTSRHLIDDV